MQVVAQGTVPTKLVSEFSVVNFERLFKHFSHISTVFCSTFCWGTLHAMVMHQQFMPRRPFSAGINFLFLSRSTDEFHFDEFQWNSNLIEIVLSSKTSENRKRKLKEWNQKEKNDNKNNFMLFYHVLSLKNISKHENGLTKLWRESSNKISFQTTRYSFFFIFIRNVNSEGK